MIDLLTSTMNAMERIMQPENVWQRLNGPRARHGYCPECESFQYGFKRLGHEHKLCSVCQDAEADYLGEYHALITAENVREANVYQRQGNNTAEHFIKTVDESLALEILRYEMLEG